MSEKEIKFLKEAEEMAKKLKIEKKENTKKEKK